MYCVSLMDRTNLGIASVGGMAVGKWLQIFGLLSNTLTAETDLQTQQGFRYSTITLVFFITYVILQPPATVVLRKVGPRVFLPAITILWGITAIMFGFVRTWWQMIPLRLVLGIFEAGFFPGCKHNI